MNFTEKAWILRDLFDWPIFPVGLNKHPLNEHGRNGSSKDETQIKEWAEQFPNANVAVPTGQESGIFVIDLDTPEAITTYKNLGRLPQTLQATTGRGVHLYFTWMGGRIVNRAGKLVSKSKHPYRGDTWIETPGLDVRGDGGQIIVPPSKHSSGRDYEWVDMMQRIAMPPPWLLRMLGEKCEAKLFKKSEATHIPSLDSILNNLIGTKEGGRNHALNVAAFRASAIVKARQMNEQDVINSLLSVALSIGLTRHESMTTIKSGLSSGMQNPIKK